VKVSIEEPGSDRILLFTIIALTLFGLVVVYSSSYVIATRILGSGSPSFFLRRHIIRMIPGFFLLLVFMRMNEYTLRTIARPLILISLGLLVLTLIPTDLRLSVRGAHRWLRIGNFTFQPSEVARLALVIYLADFAARKGEQLRKFRVGFLPAFVIVAVAALMTAFQPNLGTATMLVLIGMVILFASGARLSHVVAMTVLSIGTMFLVMELTGYNSHRLGSSASYHVTQARIAVGSGGLFGLGIANGNQKYLFVPDAHTDFAFAIVGEEMGFMGMLALMSLFGVFVWRGLKAAARASSVFSSVLAVGITMAVAGYFCVSACVCLGLLPTAGLPMPFISYGGTSSIMLLAACGMLLGASRRRSDFAGVGRARWEALTR